MTFPAEHMSEALSLARKGLLTTRPNPMVGCVITHNEKIIGRGWHEKSGDNHAEINAIHDVFRNLGSNAESALENSEMYVTLEPCMMCAGAIIHARISRLVYATSDEKTGFINSRNNLDENGWLNHKLDITSGILDRECSKLIKNFFKDKRSKY